MPKELKPIDGSKKSCSKKAESKQQLSPKSADPRMVELVKVLARAAAEQDYERILPVPANDNEPSTEQESSS